MQSNLQLGTQNSVEVITHSFNFKDNNYLLTKLQPPKEGQIVPSVFICLIDISGSMGSEAAIRNSSEGNGFSRLDLVKHSLNTIIHSLDSTHYLSVITFSNTAIIEFEPVKLTDSSKKMALDKIDQLQPTNSTNIWDALKAGVDVAQQAVCKEKNVSIILLTDGEPNVNPPEGISQALKNYLQVHPLSGTISTFGFGYNLDSVLLSEIAQIGLGQFAFIPDASMVGTIFVNFLSNGLATFLVNKKISFIDKDKSISLLEQNIGAIQYDQSKDYLIKLDKCLNVEIDFGLKKLQIEVDKVKTDINDEFLYQYMRYEIIRILNECQKVVDINENSVNKLSEFIEKEYENLKGLAKCEKTQQLLNDLNSNDPDYGQITKAVSRADWLGSWGQHYLKSLCNAHVIQVCNNFRDPGVQLYAGHVFNSFREVVDKVFVSIKPPKPSINESQQVASMASYYNCRGPCFNGYGKVRMNDNSMKQVKDLKKGDIVQAGYKILCMIKTKVEKMIEVVDINGLIITAWHPIMYNNQWQFPIKIKSSEMQYVDYLYNIVFQDGHILLINDIPVVGLGHGFTGSKVIEHDYFGTSKVIEDLKKIHGWNNGLIEIDHYDYDVDRNTGTVKKMIINSIHQNVQIVE